MDKTVASRTVELEIVELTKKGNGIGYLEMPEGKRRTVEVPFAIPGDFVRAYLIRKRSGVFLGHLEEVLRPSKDRIEPRCVHFGVCGGCRWQQVSYEQQLQYKENSVRKTFAPLLSPSFQINPIVACDPPWHYRNKMEFSFSQDAAKKKFLGLVMDSGKGKVLNVTECHLVNPWFIEALKTVRAWWHESDLDAFHLNTNQGSLRNLTVREGKRSGDRLVMLTVSGNPDFALNKHHLQTFVAFLRDAIEPVEPSSHLSIFLRIQQTARGVSTNFYEMLLYGPDYIRETLSIQIDPNEPPFSLQFHVSPAAFFQPNTQQAEKLYSLALQMAKIPKDGVVYDLYCGTGTLGICAAKQAKQVMGIEISPESALDARTNAARNGLDNVTIISGAVRHVLPQIASEEKLPHPDMIMVDPPRPGLDPEAMKRVIDLKAPKILYISCNPITQAENVAEFINSGYRIEAIQPVDQFPQTPHIENIVILELLHGNP